MVFRTTVVRVYAGGVGVDNIDEGGAVVDKRDDDGVVIMMKMMAMVKMVWYDNDDGGVDSEACGIVSLAVTVVGVDGGGVEVDFVTL